MCGEVYLEKGGLALFERAHSSGWIGFEPFESRAKHTKHRRQRMKKLATSTAAAALMVGIAMSMGTSGAVAGGMSDSSGEGVHCYLYFTGNSIPDELDTIGLFAQVMINDVDDTEVDKKIGEAVSKLVNEGFELTFE